MLLGVIADDLTGANDTGVQFTKKGMKTQVLIDMGRPLPPDDPADVVVWNTDSRALPSAEAKERAIAAAKVVKGLALQHIYKKVDSTLRGNLGAEIDGILDETGLSFAVIAPAFPQNGRTTENGIHRLFGQPVAETEMARDLKTPINDSCLPRLLAAQSQYPVAHISRDVIVAGRQAVKAAVMEQLDLGRKLLSFDVLEEGDLSVIAGGANAVGRPVLWVGSAALAEVLPGIFGWDCRKEAEILAGQSGPVLIAAGSVSEVTSRQLNYFIARSRAFTLVCDPEELFNIGPHAWERHLSEATAALKQGTHLVLTTSHDREAIARTQMAGTKAGLLPGEVSELVVRALGRLVAKLDCKNIAGMLLTGGDTAIAVCRELEAVGIEVLAEIAPGIPLGKLIVGNCSGLRVVTKAGAFGKDHVVTAAVEMLTGGINKA